MNAWLKSVSYTSYCDLTKHLPNDMLGAVLDGLEVGEALGLELLQHLHVMVPPESRVNLSNIYTMALTFPCKCICWSPPSLREQASEDAFNLWKLSVLSQQHNIPHTAVDTRASMDIGELKYGFIVGSGPSHLPSPFGPHHWILISCIKIRFFQGLDSSQVISKTYCQQCNKKNNDLLTAALIPLWINFPCCMSHLRMSKSAFSHSDSACKSNAVGTTIHAFAISSPQSWVAAPQT